MNKRERAELFAKYVGLALKGRIITQGFTAKAVATEMRRSPAAFNRWLNGKVELPLSVFAEACELIDIEPQSIIEDAYSRLCLEHGERDGTLHPGEIEDYSYPAEHDNDNVTVGRFGQNSKPADNARAAFEDDGDDGEDLE